jgi:molybdopterin molybdotransferase
MTQSQPPAPRLALQSLDDALAQVLSTVSTSPRTEWVETFDADARVLAEAVTSPLNVPGFDNSAMDGYALRACDVPAPGTVLEISQRIPAGAKALPLKAGTAARIFTGAAIPPGADAVLMQEDAQVLSEADAQAFSQSQTQVQSPADSAGQLVSALGAVRVNAKPVAGQWLRRLGEDIQAGELILQPGLRLTPAHLGLIASVGQAKVRVVAKPRVALFSTGDELVMPGDVAPADMRPGAIYNSNRFFLRALLQRLGCIVTDYGIVPDQREATLQALQAAAQAHELILTSGGVSVGEEDHVKPAVQALGRLDLWSIAMKPGKPFAHGQIGSAHFMGLPGNPVSSWVTFLLLVRPFLLRLQGIAQTAVPSQQLVADFDWPKPDKRREFLRARRKDHGQVSIFANQSSAVLTSTTWADGLIDNPGGQAIAKGDVVRFMAFSDLLT